MKRLSLLILTVLSVGTWLAPLGGQQPDGGGYVPGEIIVKFTRGVSANRRQALMASKGSTIVRRFDEVELDHVRLRPGKSVTAALAELRGNPEITFAQPNYTYEATELAVAPGPPNDPFWLNDSMWGMQKIAAQQAWNTFGGGNNSVIIADIDTGVDYTHPDLAANMWRNSAEIPGNSVDDDHNGYIDDVYGIDAYNHDSNPIDDNSHGTHTAGTIAAVGNNGVGVVGVNWNARILACKFLSASGSGSDLGAIECFNYITALKNRGENIRVSSNSWGSSRGSGVSTALKNAMDAAGNAGILNICAAGNSGSNNDGAPFDPASFTSSSIVSVASSDGSDNRSGFSNFGVTSVDLAAPGENIISTVPGGYGNKSGTSMATPHVAGVAAYVASLAPTLSVDGLKAVLMQNVDVLPQWAGVVAAGGRLNAFRAANAVAVPTSDTINVALASNGGAALASSTYSSAYPASGSNNGDRRGVGWGTGGGWNDATSGTWPDWLEVDFNGSKTIGEVDVFTIQDNYTSPVEPTLSTTFSSYGIRDFSVQYWSGSSWLSVPNGTVSNNNQVWRQFTFAPVTTTRIRVLVTGALAGFTRITEIEAYTAAAGSNAPPTVQLDSPANGSTFTAPATINLAATAADSDGSITSVDFYAAGNLIGSDGTSPYSVNWSGVAAGTYSLTAVATDNVGATVTSVPITVTVSPGPSGGTNFALAANGGMTVASSTFNANYPSSSVINGDRRGINWGSGGGWNDATAGAWPDWIEVDFASSQSVSEVDVFTVQDSFSAPASPTANMTFSSYGIRDFEVQYWNGASWQPIPNGTVSNNNLVWRQFLFSPLVTQKIRIWITGALASFSRITEIEAYGSGAPPNAPPTASLTAPASGATFVAPATIDLTATASDTDGSITGVAFYANGVLLGTDSVAPYGFTWSPVSVGSYVLTAIATDNAGATGTSGSATVSVVAPSVNVALASNGGVTTASSSYGNGYPSSAAIDGDRKGLNWGSGGGWNDATGGGWPDWLQIDFNASQTIGEIDVYTLQDSYGAPSDPTPSMTFGLYGIRSFEVQYWTGSAWVPVPGGVVTNNNLVWRQFLFSPISTPRIRVWITDALESYSRVVEVEAYTGSGATQPAATVPSTIALRADLIGTFAPASNATSPVIAGSNLLLLSQTGSLYRWNGIAQPLLTAAAAPAGVTPTGPEAFLNAAANASGTALYVMFTSSSSPAGVPQRVSPRPGADAWQVLYRYDFNGTALSNPLGIVALQVRSDGHTGGGMAVLSDGAVLFATGDNGDPGEDGRAYAQDISNHLSKIVRIDPTTSAVTVLAAGVRNVQRLFVNPNAADPRVEFIDIGGAVAEELNSVRLADLLSTVKNFGWGRNAGDNRAREGTFYIDPSGAFAGSAPTPEAGFVQPVAQFGREGAQLVGGSGTVSSTVSFTNVSALFGDLPSGSVFAVTGVPGASNQTVYRVNVVDSGLQPVTLAGLAGGRPDPRFFLFPDGTAGVLLEKTGAFYRLTQIAQ